MSNSLVAQISLVLVNLMLLVYFIGIYNCTIIYIFRLCRGNKKYIIYTERTKVFQHCEIHEYQLCHISTKYEL